MPLPRDRSPVRLDANSSRSSATGISGLVDRVGESSVVASFTLPTSLFAGAAAFHALRLGTPLAAPRPSIARSGCLRHLRLSRVANRDILSRFQTALIPLERPLRFRRDINVNSFGHIVCRGGRPRWSALQAAPLPWPPLSARCLRSAILAPLASEHGSMAQATPRRTSPMRAQAANRFRGRIERGFEATLPAPATRMDTTSGILPLWLPRSDGDRFRRRSIAESID